MIKTPDTSEAVDFGTSPPSEGDSKVMHDDSYLPDMRVGCTAGSPLLMTKKPVSDGELDDIDAAGIVIDPEAENSDEIIQHLSRVALVEFDQGKYLDAVISYCRHHGQKNALEFHLGGPGLITILKSIGDLSSLEAFRLQILPSANPHNADDFLLKMALDQPVVVRADTADEVATDEAKVAVGAHALHGFIFRDVKEMQEFGERWNKIKIGKTRIPYPEPTIFLEGSSDAIGQYFQNENNFADDRTTCDAYIVNDRLSRERARKISDLRLLRIEEAHSDPIEEPLDGSLLVGIVNLQGAAKVERLMIRKLREQATFFHVKTEMVHTRQEMENLDGIVLPAGWSGSQLPKYERMGIIEGLRDALREKRMAMYFSCAGAILAGNSKKKRVGCSAHPPADLLDYGVINNHINGEVPIIFQQGSNGGRTWITKKTPCVGAPVFVNVNQTELEPIALTEGHEIVAVEGTNPKHPPILASAVHTERLYKRWLRKLGEHEWQKLEDRDA